MTAYPTIRHSRRAALRAWLAGSTPILLLAACGRSVAAQAGDTRANRAEPAQASAFAQQAQVLEPTPACLDDDDPTPSQTEGPYFTPNSPERTSLLEPGMLGTRIVVSGRVLSADCQPVAGALVDFWQADDRGVYDNVGYTLRGHQFTDDAGRYQLESIVPGLYPGRTRHFHVKVQAPNHPMLTTQLYFPGEQSNARDRIFHSELLLNVQDGPDGKQASFDFVLDLA